MFVTHKIRNIKKVNSVHERIALKVMANGNEETTKMACAIESDKVYHHRCSITQFSLNDFSVQDTWIDFPLFPTNEPDAFHLPHSLPLPPSISMFAHPVSALIRSSIYVIRVGSIFCVFQSIDFDIQSRCSAQASEKCLEFSISK